MNLVDTHCHLDLEPLAADFEGAVERAAQVGVRAMINVGASMRGSERSVKLANSYPHIYAAVGLHPHEAETLLDLPGAITRLRNLATNEKVVAIGEIGLDYFDPQTKREVALDLKEKQKALFLSQLKLAAELRLPLVFHVRDAWEDFFKIVKEEKIAGGVVHCFTAGPEEVKKCINLGLYVGFTGIITFKSTNTDSIREAVIATPLNRTLAETDAPFLTPEPHRGKVNEPAYVSEVYAKIAELKNISISDLALQVNQNIYDLFGIKI